MKGKGKAKGKASQRQGQKKKQKMKDINRKGVEKEGTEMDAFTESNQDAKEKAVPSAPTTVNNNPPQSALSNKTPLVEKISKDELEEKIVAAKNEENAKLSSLSKTEEDSSPATIIEKSQPPSQPQITLKYKYKEDQWSPLNTGGKKIYERDFLLNLQTEPQSMKKPENLPNLEVVLQDHTNRRISSQPIYSNRGGGHDFSPNFFRSGPSGSKGGGPMPIRGERRSIQGKGGSGKSGSSKSGLVTHISLQLKDEVKLRETENAWKPARFNSAKELTEEQRKTQDLYKKVRSILNKLTPQKFETLVKQVQALPVDTAERLQGVIDLVFDKAIDEPGFAKAYANMCKLVGCMEVKEEKSNDGKEGGGSVVFRKLLLARCQAEFEKNRADELNSEKRFQEINLCTDPEKKKELQLSYEEEERRIRRKSVGNIRFIGELYKLKMLTSGIMHRCIHHLLSKHEEESLECLCKLLTTIGKDLEAASKESNMLGLDGYFDKMGELSQKRENSKISSRVRFMLQDVIDLRHNKWVPRRDDNNPKTIDQIQRDADRENMEMSLALSAPRKQDIRGNDSDRKGKNRGSMNQDDKEGWTNVGGTKSFRPYQYEPSRIQVFKQQELSSVSLGSASQFNQWSRGANSKTTDKSDSRSIIGNNIYSHLSKERDNDKKHTNIVRTGKITPSPSMEKERMMSGLKEAMDSERQSHRVQQSSQPPSRDRTPTPARASAVPVQSVPAVVAPPSLKPEEIERKAKLIAEEYLCNNNNFEEAKQSIEDLDRNVNDILYEILKFTFNLKVQQRSSIGKLFADLIDIKFLMQNLVVSLYEKLCDQIVAEEWIIDVPLIWTYFAELIAPLVKTDKITFADLRTVSKAVIECRKEFFVPLIQVLCKEYGENVVRAKWVSSKVKLTDFVDNPNDATVLKAVEFLSRKGDPSSPSISLPMEEVHKKLTNFLQNDKMNFDTIVEWINTNVGEKVKEPQFIRALTIAICEFSISSNKKLMEQSFRKNVKLITRFIDHIEELEVQCLCTIHAYVTKLEHPSGLLMKIFNELWEYNVISSDAFIKWRDSDTVEEGKGVSVKSLTSFFTNLNEGEMSDEAS